MVIFAQITAVDETGKVTAKIDGVAQTVPVLRQIEPPVVYEEWAFARTPDGYLGLGAVYR